MEEAGHRVRRPATLQAWMRAYAAATATTTSWEKIRDAAGPGSDTRPARSTTIPYVEALTRLRILDELLAMRSEKRVRNGFSGLRNRQKSSAL